MSNNQKLAPYDPKLDPTVQPESLYRALVNFNQAVKLLCCEIENAPPLWREQYRSIYDYLTPRA